MKIDRLELFRVNVPWRQRYATSYNAFDEIEHVFVKVRTDQGPVGYGEVVSFPFFTGESTGTIIEVLKLLEPVVKGCNPFDIEKIMVLADRTVKYNNSTKAALDFALHDIMGKSLGLNAVYLVGGMYREKIPLSWSLTIGEPEAVAEEAVEMVQKGFQTVNLKIGVNPDEDVERIKKVRQAVGEKVHLRADANAAFHTMQAIQFINRIEPYQMEYVEQPVPGWDLDGMAEVRRHVNVRISADESAYYLHSAVEMIKKGSADIFSLKVAKMGGIRKTMQFAAIAEAANIPCLMNSNFELDIGVAAAAVVSAAAQMVQYSCETSGPLRHQTEVITKGVEYKNGFIIPSTAPGLGIEVDEKGLEKYRVY